MDNKKSAKGSDDAIHVGLPSKLTDVGAFSYSSLCGVSLLQLFDDDWNREFNKLIIDAILQHLGLPAQCGGTRLCIRSSLLGEPVSLRVMIATSCDAVCSHNRLDLIQSLVQTHYVQVCISVRAISNGSGMDDPKPFADTLLKDPCLHGSGLPVITDLVTLSISHGQYDSRLRMLIKHVAWQLRVSWDHLEEIEALLAETLEAKHYEMSEEEANEKKNKSRNQKVKRFALIGLATVGGGALIGLTGGLAAPLVAAGASAIIGGAGAAALGTTAGVAIIGSLFGVAGAGLTGHKMKRRFGAIEEFSFEPMISGGPLQRAPTAKQLHITLCVTGWLSKSMTDVKIPWKNLAESQEQYCLRYESKHLCVLGDAIEYFISGAVSMATQEALKYTVLSAIITAIAWPAVLISAANVIDNPWGVCLQRSIATGKELAETLLAREQGNRPVTLIGYSLGARVIFYCLEEMSRRKCCEGIIEDVILLGAPVTGDSRSWERFGQVVAGKIINGYSKADWLLKFLYRTSSVQFSVAGLQPIKWDNRRMHNIDLSDIVGGHGDYLNELDTIMKIVGVRTKQDIVIQPLTSGTMMARSGSSLSFTSSEGEDESGEEFVEESHDQKKNLLNPDSMSTGQPTQNALNQLHVNDAPDEKGDISSEELNNKSPAENNYHKICGDHLSTNKEIVGVEDKSANSLSEVKGKLDDSNIGSECATQQLDDMNIGSDSATQQLDNTDLSTSNDKMNSHQHSGKDVKSNSSQFENNNIHDAKLS